MKRRTLLAALAAAPIVPTLNGAWQTAHATPLIGAEDALVFPEGKDVLTILEYYELEQATTGNLNPYAEEIRRGQMILDAAPTNTRPLAVALYFLDLRQGEQGNDISVYAQEWPSRYNPVIVSFFDQTQVRRPNGDITPWCSAFVNWCLWRSRVGMSADRAGQLPKPTSHAAAQSWKDWGDPVPGNLGAKYGDIAVFERVDAPGKGHVGFFVQEDEDHVVLLGGNQAPANGKNNGEVNISRFAKNGTRLRLLGYRTHPSLHSTT